MSNRMTRPKPSMRAMAAERDAQRHRAARRRRIAVGASIGLALAAGLVAGGLVWMASSSPTSGPAMAPVALQAGCGSCHSVDGSRREGPTWEGLAGASVPLDDGSIVVADQDYLRRAIDQPSIEVRQGYPPMPAQDLTDAQVEELVDYIEGLG